MSGRRIVVIALLAAALTWWLSPARADAAPYGGCDEAWRYPASAGAQDCRDAGWTVTRRILVGPHGHVRWTNYRPCRTEDSLNCIWRANRQGNRLGRSFYVNRVGTLTFVLTRQDRR